MMKKKKKDIGAFGHPIYGKGFAKMYETPKNIVDAFCKSNPLPEREYLTEL